jgi:tripartite ATP-independent transporter DctM subunit
MDFSLVVYGILAIAIFCVFMFLGMNIPYAMMFGGAVAVTLFRGPIIAGQMIVSDYMSIFSDYTLSVGPMFGFMGYIATYTGIGEKLFVCLKAFVGHRRGGLAQAVQIASCGFGAICGTPPAAAATMTAVAYPEMRKSGYSVELAAMTIQNGTVLSVLIPPSGTLIIYGLATQNSIGRLFLSGLVPGIICCAAMVLLISLLCKIHPAWGPTTPKATPAERIRALRNGGIIEVIVVFIIAMGGMFAGIFTPTEAGSVGVLGMLIVTLVGRNINFRKMRHSALEGVRLCAMMYMIMGSATVFGHVIGYSTLPTAIAYFVAKQNLTPIMVMVMILILYFIFGCVADLMAMVLATIPVFYPLITDYCGYDPVWFGILIIFMMSVGAMTPPVGGAVFLQKLLISNHDPNVPLSLLFRAAVPWIFLNFIMVAILLLFPQITTFLPNLIG